MIPVDEKQLQGKLIWFVILSFSHTDMAQFP